MAKPSVREIVDARGGYRVVADALTTPGDAVAPTTVHGWCRSNRLPPYRREAVLALPEAECLIRRRRQGDHSQAAA